MLSVGFLDCGAPGTGDAMAGMAVCAGIEFLQGRGAVPA